MTLFIISFLGGALTVLAPCILPVIPFVFARVDQPFVKSGLPMLVGMASTFAAVGTLGAAAGSWAVEANEYGRIAATALLGLMGAAMVFPRLAERLTRPLVSVGLDLSNAANAHTAMAGNCVLPSFIRGVATGLLWAPCAGPILGLILTGAVLQGPNVKTSLLLLAYGAGAVSSLALVLLAGHRIFAAMKRSLGIGEWFRKGLGITVLSGAVVVMTGVDTGWLAQVSSGSVEASVEKMLLQHFAPRQTGKMPIVDGQQQAKRNAPGGRLILVQAQQNRQPLNLPVEGLFPPLTGAVDWLNSPPLTVEALRGKVVLVNFWTFGCINCRNVLPYVRDWDRKYKDQGLVVVSVHAPEFAYEKNIENVKRAASELGATFPIAIDNRFEIWKAFNNNYWPANYFIDSQGRIRFHHFGEGEYEKSERVIQQLLKEARVGDRPVPMTETTLETLNAALALQRAGDFVAAGVGAG